jgi:hypothetical protein
MAIKTRQKPPRPTTGSVKQRQFLAAYRECGIISLAAKAAGCERRSHSMWMARDPDYPALFAEAKEEACESLEKEARRRAVEGVDRPVYQGGRKIGTLKEYSDVLLIFLMKGAMPDKYKDRYSQDVTVTVDVSDRLAAGRERAASIDVIDVPLPARITGPSATELEQ